VTAKPDLYPLVIGYDESLGKGTSGFVMRYFRSLSHASTLDSLSSSFMCNVVNEANTVVPPPYSCDSADELSAVDSCDRRPTANVGSTISLTNHRTTSDVSSLAAQSPCSPPRATSPTIEVRFSTLRCDSYFRVDDETTHSSFRPHYFLYRLSRWTIHFLRDSHLPRLESIDVSGIRFSRDVRSSQLRELLDKIQQLPRLSNGHATAVPCQPVNQTPVLRTSANDATRQQRPPSPGDVQGLSRVVGRTRGKLYVPLGLPNSRSKTKRWLSRSAPTTPSGAIPMSFLPGQSASRPSDANVIDNEQAAVPLLSEQDENENANADQPSSDIPLLARGTQERDRRST